MKSASRLAVGEQFGLGGVAVQRDRRRTSSPHVVCGTEGDRLGRKCASTSSIRGEIFAAAIDHPSGVGQREIAVLVEDSLIAGPEPAIDEGRGVGLGLFRNRGRRCP